MTEDAATWRERIAAEEAARREAVRGLPTRELRCRGELTPPLDGDELLHLSLSPHGDPVALWARPADRAEQFTKDVLPNGVGVPRTRVPRPVTARFVTYQPEPVVTPLETTLAVPYAQPLSGGRVLVVGARCEHRGEEGPERNATLYDAEGRVLARGTLGDGISYVRCDADDGIWVGYHEEGVYGNFGWGHPHGPPPIGQFGLNRFTTALTETESQHLPGAFPTTGSRLTLEGTTAWLTFEVPGERVVLRFDPLDGRDPVGHWSLDETCGGAAVPLSGGTQVVLVGGLAGERDLLTYAELAEGRVHPGSRHRLSLPGGDDLGPYTWWAHGETLHVFTGTTWWTTDLEPQ